jgi:hypothetical protein
VESFLIFGQFSEDEFFGLNKRAYSNKMRKLGKSVLVLALLALPTVSLAEVSHEFSELGSRKTLVVFLEGEIVSNDYDIVRELLPPEDSSTEVKVHLDSVGGSVSAAMAIGELVRLSQAITFLSDQDICLSACLFVLIAGVERHLYGSVGIHRPFFGENIGEDTPSFQEVDEFFKKLQRFMASMGANPQLFYIMAATEPEEMLFFQLSSGPKGPPIHELNRYVPFSEPAYTELKMLESAVSYGLSVSEYRRRIIDGSAACAGQDLSAWTMCVQNYIGGQK